MLSAKHNKNSDEPASDFGFGVSFNTHHKLNVGKNNVKNKTI